MVSFDICATRLQEHGLPSPRPLPPRHASVLPDPSLSLSRAPPQPSLFPSPRRLVIPPPTLTSGPTCHCLPRRSPDGRATRTRFPLPAPAPPSRPTLLIERTPSPLIAPSVRPPRVSAFPCLPAPPWRRSQIPRSRSAVGSARFNTGELERWFPRGSCFAGKWDHGLEPGYHGQEVRDLHPTLPNDTIIFLSFHSQFWSDRVVHVH